MLYDLWRDTVDRQGDRWAVRDLALEQSWTFRELELASAGGDEGSSRYQYPQGMGVGFLLATIRGWRQGRVICPLEEGQMPPALEGLPAGCIHLKSTSATTGRARYIGFSANQLIADAGQIVATMGLRPDWPNLGVISLAHSYGYSNLVLPLLLHGIPLVLGNSALPEVVRQVERVCGGITLPAVPALWRAWHQAGAIPRNIRLAISAGARLPLALETDIFSATGVKIHNFYGASECGGIAYDGSEVPREAETCAGRAMEGVDVSKDDSGCLCVRSAAVGLTYLPEPDPGLQDGRFLTSDLAELQDGEIHLLGRATEVINVAGRKVVPETVENALLGFPDIAGCVVFGIPSSMEERGETIVALVASRRELDVGALRRFLSVRVAAWQVPRVWCGVESLQLNARGKLSRAEWRRRYLEQDGSIRPLGRGEA